MTITVSAFISDVRTVLQDTGATPRWSNDELLSWLNAGQRELVEKKPEVNTKVATVQLAAGTRQTLPDDGVQFFRLLRNTDSAGSVPGEAVRTVDYSALEGVNLLWHAATAATEVTDAAFRPSDPTHYYVYPPADGSGFVDIEYGALLPDCTLGGTLNARDVWQPSLLNYVLYRAYAKDAEYAANAQLAASYYEAFRQSLSDKAAAEATRAASQGA